MIWMIFMMFEILLDHFIRHMTRTESGITNTPKMLTPIVLS